MFISTDSSLFKIQMAGYESEVTFPFPNLGFLSVLLSEAVQWAVDAENREQAIRSELEQTKAQLVATEDRVRAILQLWEKSKTDYVRLPKKAYQDC